MIPRMLVGAALLGTSAIVFLPFSRAHFAWRDLADAYIHLVRIYAVDAALARGDLYPRWLPDLYLGYGYPLLNFYAPATYYLGSLFHRLGATIYGSLQLIAALAVLLGAGGAYALARSLQTRQSAALLAAGAYALAPYPFITNLYVRAAIPEALALGEAPWVFLAAHRAVRAPGPAALTFFASSVALLTLTHNVTALTTLPFVALLALAAWLPARRAVAARTVMLGAAAGLALSAFFWLPALAESRYVQLDLLGGGIYHFRTWLFEPLGGLTGHTIAYDYSALDRAVPATPSPLYVLLLNASLAIALIKRRLAVVLPWLIVATTCLFLNTTWSTFLWDRLPLLSMTQFPWRLYGIFSLAAALAFATALPSWSNGAPSWRGWAVPTLLLLLLAYSALARRPLLLAPDPPHDVDSRLLASEEYNRYGAGTTSGGEFLPRTAQWGEGPRDRRRGIRVYDELYPQVSWQAGVARVLAGRAAITGVWRTTHAISLDVNATEPTSIAVHQLLFPGWRALIDGEPVPLETVPQEPERGVSLGFMTLDVPPGSHRVEVRFGSTPVRTAAAALSGAAVAGLVLVAVRAARKPAWIAGVMLAGTLGAVVASELPGHLPAHRSAAASRVTVDVLSAIAGGRASALTPLGRSAGPMPPYADARYLNLGGDTRRWLFLHPPSEVSIPLTVPTNSYLQSALAIEPVAWSHPVGDGVRFLAELEFDGRRVTVLDRALDPRTRPDERGWIDVWADLRPFAGRTGRLILRTDARDEPSFDWAGWAHPQVVLWRSPRPAPPEPHPW